MYSRNIYIFVYINDRLAEKSGRDSCFLPGWERDESRIDRSTLEALPVVFHRVARVCPFACRDDFEVIVSGNEGTEGRPRDPMFRQGLIFKALLGILRFQIALVSPFRSV